MGREHSPFITAYQAEVLELLVRRHTLSNHQIVEAVYADDPNGGPENAIGALEAQMYHIRKKLAPYGVTITTLDFGSRYGAKYHLDHDNRERVRYLLAQRVTMIAARNINQLELFAHA
jgi:hypothetical protein